MRYIVIGAGAVGGTIGARLHQGGHDVLLIARGAHHDALRRFARVYGMCVWLPASHLEPGVVAAYGHPYSGMLHVGRYPRGVDDLALRVAADLGKHGLVARAVADVMRWKHGKLVGNLANAVEALVGRPEGMGAVVERARAEARAVLDRAGIAYASPGEESEVRGHQVDHHPVEGVARGGGSSWQSLARASGSIEAGYLNGEIVLLGRLHGVPTPVNDVLRGAADAHARDRLPPGSMPLERLVELIDARCAAESR
ncbi:MAG TPA: 2-dehydropantoate 2-reductase N-terminal domain-containing protein [Nonomuraea sp.]|nr:2-dehydropantoate 2-reductase N-terminal domain-containing protein [Nonomuraea sp.]